MLGKPTFAMFIDPRADDQIALLKNVCQGNRENNLAIVAFIRDTDDLLLEERLLCEVEDYFGDITVITEDYDRLKEIFGSPQCCENFYLFDKAGRLILSDLNWRLLKSGPNALKERLGVQYMSLGVYLRPGTSIYNVDGFEPIAEILEENPERSFYS